MPLVVNCGAGGALQSAYFAIKLAIADVQLPTVDLPPYLGTTLAGVTTKSPGIAAWTSTASAPAAVNGVWSSGTTYGIGDTVYYGFYDGIRQRSYLSLRTGNLGHTPDAMDGFWSDLCQPPHIANMLMPAQVYGYALDPLPTSLASAVWTAALTHSLFWNVTAPGDQNYLYDVAIKLNYVGSSMFLRPTRVAATTGSQGAILNAGLYATFQCWHTSGVSTAPLLTLDQWPAMPGGVDASPYIGGPYSVTLTAAGGTPPYTFGIIGSLPDGLTLNPTTGVISGTPTVATAWPYTVQVTDALGATAQVTCGLVSGCAPATALYGNSFY